MPPTAKEVKYDRQLRLWSSNGQEALENARLCLINASATGTEILKNLVLPGHACYPQVASLTCAGIGGFTILDAKITDGEDVGVSFFLEEESIGRARGEEACSLINEMNPDVKGEFVLQNPEDIISSNAQFFRQFSIVIATGLNEQTSLQLAKILWEASIPLILVRSIGFIGSFRIIIPEITLVETHPEDVVDLRLDCPWPELARLASSINLSEMDDFEHGHVPYVLILLKFLEQWKLKHGTAPTMRERKLLNEELLKEKRNLDEENFDEAIAASFRACRTTEIPSDIQNILTDPKTKLSPQSTNFWILAKCVHDFVSASNSGNGALPLMGAVPDMKADSNRYILIQNWFSPFAGNIADGSYRRKFKADLADVSARVAATLRSLGRAETDISADEIEAFCKHAGYLKVIRYRSLEEEYSSPRTKFIQGEFENTFPPTLIHYYLALRAYDRFLQRYNRPPGSTDSDEDLPIMTRLVDEILGDTPTNVEMVSNACAEIIRAGGGELHNIASLMGGLVAQEAIKLITKQYIPSDNTCIFDGITSSSNVWAL